jgi:tRNA G18 (ribose-2'-O)-methylase SpoU
VEIVDAVAALRSELGATIVAAAPRSGMAIDALDRPARVTLVVGNEGDGLDPTVLDLADRYVHVPMAPGVDSLNVASAAAIMLWALTRSRPISE